MNINANDLLQALIRENAMTNAMTLQRATIVEFAKESEGVVKASQAGASTLQFLNSSPASALSASAIHHAEQPITREVHETAAGLLDLKIYLSHGCICIRQEHPVGPQVIAVHPSMVDEVIRLLNEKRAQLTSPSPDPPPAAPGPP